ncbi:hypothetical protein CISG_08105 [Coccidioides immitis RMSCC 3703]|uniref:Uncharacterized protein n=1 Tax=Coccidioides immitis RMSCC 3703 TaxID=454286 RepID=A0A0J8R5V3_COCIT|nr:hypothetical protein CISG_08105 [Coccidioides immitis RMSCC 3703]
MAVVLRKSPRPWMIMREILEYFCNADPQGSARDYYVGPEELYAKEALSMNYRLPEEFRNGLYLRLNLRCKDLGGAGNTNSPRYELEGPKGASPLSRLRHITCKHGRPTWVAELRSSTALATEAPGEAPPCVSTAHTLEVERKIFKVNLQTGLASVNHIIRLGTSILPPSDRWVPLYPWSRESSKEGKTPLWME